MAETTVGVSDSTKQRLEDHRGDSYISHDEYIDAVLDVVPSAEELQEGCTNCGRVVTDANRIEQAGGVVRWSHHKYDDDEFIVSNYFCSADCLKEYHEEAKKHIPRNPDEVLVGGKDELRTGFEGATFFIDADTFEVGLDIPGAFGGSDEDGEEYDYIGEPVYIKNEGEVVQEGIIEDIIHEDAHTALLLKHSAKTKDYRPDE